MLCVLVHHPVSFKLLTLNCTIEYLGKIGSMSSWIWVDAKVDGKPYVGAMPPITALAEGE
jgi:hypothetical protein